MLILDVLKYIATYSEDVWYKLTLIDEDFKKYAYGDAGISAFINAFYKCEIRDGFMYREIFGRSHSFDDLPACVSIDVFDGIRQWYYNGEFHRANDKPAIIVLNNYKVWYKYGKTHRDNNKPAVKRNMSIIMLSKLITIYELVRHREIKNIISDTDYRIWYKDGLLHREDGHAFIDNVGVGHYYINGVKQIGIQV